jgi:hypothetical protein
MTCLTLSDIDGELDHRQAVEIGMHDDVGDVAMHEQLARQQADDLVRRHARIRAADPQVLRRLQARQLEKILGIDLLHAIRPGAVEVEEVEEVFVGDFFLDQFSRSRARNIVPSIGVW